jgi:hypothetical protein
MAWVAWGYPRVWVWLDPSCDQRRWPPPALCARCGELRYLVCMPLLERADLCEECARAEWYRVAGSTTRYVLDWTAARQG